MPRLLGGGSDRGDDVQIAVVGGVARPQRGMAVKLGVRRGIVAAAEESLVRFSDAVVGKRLPGYLPPGQTAAEGEGRKIDGVDRAAFLENVEHLLGPLVDKRR